MRNKLKRKPKTRYNKEVLVEGFGRCYTSSRNNLDRGEILIRIRFRPRKWIGSFGWDIDRQAVHIYPSRRQEHKKMRIGWEYEAFWKRDTGGTSLHNLRRKR